MNILTQEELKEYLHYDPDTGLFKWIKKPSQIVHIGSIAGTINHDGYIRIKFHGKIYSAHILAWLYMKGEYPIKQVDHWDLNRGNNKWLNLRIATQSQNMGNIHKPKNNTSGYKGVCWYKPLNKFQAQIGFNNKTIHLGYYIDPKEAARVYDYKAIELFGEFALTNF